MKIALASARIVNRDMNYNLAQIKRYMSEAKARGAELVCFGEAFLQGFNALTWKFEEDQKIAITVHSEEFAQVKALSEKLGIDVLFGYNELDRAKIYSSCALVADGKIVHNYRRISKGWKEYSITDEPGKICPWRRPSIVARICVLDKKRMGKGRQERIC